MYTAHSFHEPGPMGACRDDADVETLKDPVELEDAVI